MFFFLKVLKIKEFVKQKKSVNFCELIFFNKLFFYGLGPFLSIILYEMTVSGNLHFLQNIKKNTFFGVFFKLFFDIAL